MEQLPRPATDQRERLIRLANESATLHSLKESLRLRSWRTVLQPMVSLSTGKVEAYEALTRPLPPSPADTPADFLALTRASGLLDQTETLWWRSALEAHGSLLPPGALLFVNISPETLTRGALRVHDAVALVKEVGLRPESVVLELTESDAISDFHELRRQLGAFRSSGFQVAVDDLGAGASSLQAVVELRPDFVKLDRWLATAVAFDGARRAVVESMVLIVHRTRARVIAEGIEAEETLGAMLELGVDWGQGYLLGRPQPGYQSVDHGVSELVVSLAAGHHASLAWTRVEQLARPVLVVGADMICTKLLDVFNSGPDVDLVALAGQEDEPLEVVLKSSFMATLFGNFGFGLSLFATRPASFFATPLLTIPRDALLRGALASALARREKHSDEPLLVALPHSVVGSVSMMELVNELLKQEVVKARDANPLTGLPGNRLILQYFDNIGVDDDVVLFYADIDDFKAFNDCWGFAAGDMAIARLGAVLSAAVAGADDCFIGHIGGDDFVAVVSRSRLASVTNELRRELRGRWFDPSRQTDCAELTVTFAGLDARALRGLRFDESAGALARLKRRLKASGRGQFSVEPAPSEAAA